jgi:hypothetical protein
MRGNNQPRPFARATARRFRVLSVLLMVGMLMSTLIAGIGGSTASAQAVNPCDEPANEVVAENCQPGSPASEWDLDSTDSTHLVGYATEMSVDAGNTVAFKINTVATAYRIDVYRMGYYGGAGARKVAEIPNTSTLKQSQPACLTNFATALVDCGNWAQSASWAVPADAVSGVYLAKLVREDGTPGASHIPFVVRDDDGGSDLLYQTSDTTWQAYNEYGGASLYVNHSFPNGSFRGYKVSYNRPFITRGTFHKGYLFAAEQPMIRWLERNGYDVSYTTGIDTDRRGAELLEHKAFLSVGHDEYWSGGQRANVEAARDAGVHLAFFSGNEVFWKTRWETSIDGAETPYRTLVTYKETQANAKIDPLPNVWTGTWRDPRAFNPEGAAPENGLTGTLTTVLATTGGITVSDADGKLRLWRNTGLESLSPGSVATVGTETIGFEWDEDVDNGFRPEGLMKLSSGTFNVPQKFTDFGSNVAPGVASHSLTLHRRASGALVFGAGTIQYSWGLDDEHDHGPATTSDPILQQATLNLFADMGAQPGSRQANLVAATASTDTTRPTSTIVSPTTGANAAIGSPITISGTALDGGGAVGGVEVSTDGGATWHPASGRGAWSYDWTPSAAGTFTVRTRAVDDSGNVEIPAAGISVTVLNGCESCSIWGGVTPSAGFFDNGGPIELGVKFRASVNGKITGIQFYKSPSDVGGPHTGSLWNATTGALLATGTFANETPTGWQQMLFSAPVQITAGTTYVASYNTRFYSATGNYFTGGGFGNQLLRALGNGESGPNGVYRVGSGFPFDSFQANNYWVDVVFTTQAVSDTTPATISNVQAVNVTGNSATITWLTNEPADSVVEYGTTTAYGLSASDTSPVMSHSVPITGLTPNTTYHFHVISRDAGNNQTTSTDFNFTTPVQAGPYSLWDDTTPTPIFHLDPPLAVPIEVGVKVRSNLDGAFTAVQFYKGTLNTGTHVGHIWTAGGALLSTVTFTNETTSGWQTANLTTPVQVTAGQIYVISYTAPGRAYSYTAGYFTTGAHVNGPLTALASMESPNGVFNESPGMFPTGSFEDTNYWVDVVFTDREATGTSGNMMPPQVIARSPGPGAINAGLTAVSAAFNEPMMAPSPSDFTLTDSNGALVPGTISHDEPTHTYTFVPTNPLAFSATYTASVLATDAEEIPMDQALVWSFTTGACPCSVFAEYGADAPPSNQYQFEGPAAEAELGVKFRSDISGYITGIRFLQGPSNAGPHSGRLWLLTSPTSGTLMATTNGVVEATAMPGWKVLRFAQSVPIVANTIYVASYNVPNGGHAYTPLTFLEERRFGPLVAIANGGLFGGNGVFGNPQLPGVPVYPFSSHLATNYWVDPMFAVEPLPVSLTVSAGADATIDEGATFSRGGTVAGADTDTWTATVDYGDGSGVQPLTVNADETFALAHAYADNGTYTVTINVSGAGLTGSDTVGVTVTNVAPTAQIAPGGATSINEGGTATFRVDVADPGTADSQTIVVTWGDGATTTYNLAAGLTFVNVDHVYADDNPSGTSSDIYNVGITVTDKDNAAGTASGAVTVANLPPAAAITNAPANGLEGAAITLGSTAADASAADQSVLSYSWDVALGGAHPFMGNGSSFAFTPTDEGTYVVTLTVSDDDGGIGTATRSIVVGNVAPSLELGANASLAEGGTFSRGGSFADVGADTWSATVNYGDGTGVQPLALVDKTFALSHAYNDNGNFTVTVTINDGDSGVGTDTLTVAVSNVNPTPAIAGAPATSPKGTAINLTGSATDPSSVDTFTFAWSVTKNGAPYATGAGSSFGFTPTDAGTYVVTLTATDDDLGAASVNATISVTDPTPTVYITGGSASVAEGTAITLGSTVGNVGGGSVTYAWSLTKDGAPVTLAGPTNGNALTYTPDDNGALVFTLTVTTSGGTATTTKNVTVTNVKPSQLALNRNPTVVSENGAVTLSGSFADPGTADTHQIAISWGDGTVDTVTLGTGVLTFANIEHTYVDDNPTGSASDIATISVTVVDDDQNTGVTATTTVTVSNVAPTIDELVTPVDPVRHGTAVTVAVNFADVGAADTANVVFEWGDGTTSSVAGTISGIKSNSIGADTATIVWTTDTPTNTQVEYGKTKAYGSTTTLNPALVIDHSQTLTGLTPGTLYHYRVKSGGVVSGDFVFTTTGDSTCPCSIWAGTAVPAVAADPETDATEVGVKFRSNKGGYISGIRFYKGPGNTGTHIGKLYNRAGNLLASATFTNETATGWQQVNFAQPVEIAANTTYVASYYAPVGRYSINTNYFTNNNPIVRGPLTALASGVDGANGVFRYGAGFPNQTYQKSNYWVDVVFKTSPGEGANVSTSGSSASMSHNYADPGVYTVKVKVTDDDTGSVEQFHRYVVVYDPTGGYVAGVGWFDSPTNSLLSNPSQTGLGIFGFTSKYQSGSATIPVGTTQFIFLAGNGFLFSSTSYEWLVVNGYKAQYKGYGVVNLQGNYGFQLTAIDGERKNTGGPDQFRIRIWEIKPDGSNGPVVYDNKRGDLEDGEAATVIDGGSIKITD